VRAVDQVSLAVGAGRVVGIIGPNGAGKTTLFDLLSGYLPPDAGSITFDGRDVTSLRAHARARRGLGRSFQDARLFPGMTVAETIACALDRSVRWRDPVSAALRLPPQLEAEADVTDRVDELVELMGLGAFRDKFVGELSTGSRRIVDLACVLAHEPRLVLFDEPSSGIAQRETESLGPLLLRVRDTTGAAMVVIEHDMPLITAIADELVALDLGRVIARGTPDEVVHDPAVVASYLGTDQPVLDRPPAMPEPTGGTP
jgi:ABC-type branched-subunit amino acid transport system ATPase component